jgi:hypothetical protein
LVIARNRPVPGPVFRNHRKPSLRYAVRAGYGYATYYPAWVDSDEPRDRFCELRHTGTGAGGRYAPFFVGRRVELKLPRCQGPCRQIGRPDPARRGWRTTTVRPSSAEPGTAHRSGAAAPRWCNPGRCTKTVQARRGAGL